VKKFRVIRNVSKQRTLVTDRPNHETYQVRDDLAVAAGPEPVAGVGEVGPEVLVVVDLAVDGDDHGLVLVVEGLVAGGRVDDGEALVGEVAVAHLTEAAPVGAPVLEPPRQLQHARPLAALGLVSAPQHCKYAAHPRSRCKASCSASLACADRVE
jgi:hypothetical protein